VSQRKKSTILDIGSGGSRLAKLLADFGEGRWQVFGLDLMTNRGDVQMDARFVGFRNESFDRIVCISSIEHVGLTCGVNDLAGDAKAMAEIARILKSSGTALVTVPYGRSAIVVSKSHRVYDRRTLAALASPMSTAKSEFYCYNSGKWKKCSQVLADRVEIGAHLHGKFHGLACACLLLKKTESRSSKSE
jgi:SAM-dependent methyltransferase